MQFQYKLTELLAEGYGCTVLLADNTHLRTAKDQAEKVELWGVFQHT